MYASNPSAHSKVLGSVQPYSSPSATHFGLIVKDSTNFLRRPAIKVPRWQTGNDDRRDNRKQAQRQEITSRSCALPFACCCVIPRSRKLIIIVPHRNFNPKSACRIRMPLLRWWPILARKENTRLGHCPWKRSCAWQKALYVKSSKSRVEHEHAVFAVIERRPMKPLLDSEGLDAFLQSCPHSQSFSCKPRAII